MKDEIVPLEMGDHLIYSGVIDEAGRREATLIRQNGTTMSVLGEIDDSGENPLGLETCNSMGARDIQHVVGTGHKGPAFVNCAAFRENYERIFGSHPRDP